MVCEATVIEDMRRWLERAVIGLNLCPFAKAVHTKGQIHYAVSTATDTEALRQDLIYELNSLLAHDPSARDTTLLIAPHVLADFLDYNDFLGRSERMLRKMDLEGVVQIASFHHDFQFAFTEFDDITNTPTAPRTLVCTCCARPASTAQWPLFRMQKASSSATRRHWWHWGRAAGMI